MEKDTCTAGFALPPADRPCPECGATAEELCRRVFIDCATIEDERDAES